MEKTFKLVFVYPDGHLEEIEEQFHSGQDALEYGENLLGQVSNTEDVLNRRPMQDVFEERESIEPYFMIIEITGKKYRMVYDSRGL